MDELLTEFPVVIDLSVSWGDMDALQHVNHVEYFRYFLNGRVSYLERLDALNLMEDTGVGLILASIQCRFKRPLTYPDQLLVGTKVEKMENDRLLVRQALVSMKLRMIVAEAEALLVAFDYNTNSKAALPDELKQKIQALEK
ncbi:MAG: acyl-CoA thioesterase [Candidatus Heimdallarchaeota archaeon]|nr:MAG: acyl-CoA thioesterase [Candidatus Heimdallarchaeota archaeon]